VFDLSIYEALKIYIVEANGVQLFLFHKIRYVIIMEYNSRTNNNNTYQWRLCMNFKKLMILATLVFCISSFFGCGLIEDEKEPLDPSKPITITVWHYYNGQIKDRFDAMVGEFNETVGIERGVVVDAQSLGDVKQLANSVFDAANHKIGSQPLPDLFMAYPDNALRVNNISELVDLETLFTEVELERYRNEFLEEGRIGSDQKLLILPIAKSTENIYVNKTFWDEFSNDTGADVGKLSTWEGTVEIAELYYKHTGKAFLGIDSKANYMLLSAMQLGNEMYTFDEDGVHLNFTSNTAKNIWEYYYVPYIKGYFEKNGRFSSDDAKIGNVLAYTGSTAGASYFPTEVTTEKNEVYSIEPMTLPYPYFATGKPYAFQQGAGMCVSKSDEAHEFGAGLFLKWFTEPEQNIEFAVSAGYFPVMNESLSWEKLIEQVEVLEIAGPAIPHMMESTIYMFDNYTLYNNEPFEGSFELRDLLENHLSNKISKDLELLNDKVAGGEHRSEVIEFLISDSEFDRWYNEIVNDLSLILGE